LPTELQVQGVPNPRRKHRLSPPAGGTGEPTPDGHLLFAIRPAGDPNTIDPRPILASWKQLETALHPQGAKGESELIGPPPKVAVTKVAHAAGTGRTAPSRLVVSGELTSAQWDQLIARIALLPVPNVAAEPSASAIPAP
jgi:hypothetical protein